MFFLHMIARDDLVSVPKTLQRGAPMNQTVQLIMAQFDNSLSRWLHSGFTLSDVRETEDSFFLNTDSLSDTRKRPANVVKYGDPMPTFDYLMELVDRNQASSS